MNQKLLYIFTRTPLHVGAGSSVGAVDQPVQRERHTGFPIIPGSSIKGVLADQGNATDENGKIILDKERNNATKRTEDGAFLFGQGASKDGDQGNAGAISFGEAQLLAFPIRSAKGCFAWLTSPLALERWKRATDSNITIPKAPEANEAYFNAGQLGQTIGNAPSASALFEDYVFSHKGEFEEAKTLASAIEIDGIWSELAEKHLVLVSDETLSHFARTACEVAQHVVIDDETGTTKDGLLFNQENVPAETLFFSSLTEIKDGAIEKLNIPNPIQLGGDATTGLGFCSTSIA